MLQNNNSNKMDRPLVEKCPDRIKSQRREKRETETEMNGLAAAAVVVKDLCFLSAVIK